MNDDKEDKFIKSLKREKAISNYFYNTPFWIAHIERLNNQTKEEVDEFHKMYDKILGYVVGYPIDFCIDLFAETLLGVEHEYQTDPKLHQKGFRRK